MEDKLLIIEHEYNAPLELVWRALTEKELMTKWYFDVSDFKPEVGFKFHFEGGEKDKRYMHLCEVVEVIPHEKLKYTWQYEGYEGLSYVTFELSSSGEKTKLKLTHEGLETFVLPDFSKESFTGGWKFLLHESLKEYLENGKALRYW
ncbi:SRPBCC domain-containing protein [Aureisphaera galaxeae]|uniref:SRPBCC family protein n=1 Tax=Aureisphaera galaxeae TaxID=1538023 RepID=UPI00235055CC|nr:SRPBCC domain-containing protein [Aureisphaera galaxeae]MDC8004143.1 SRPBCC domain-containing protein [Aureisphaera galaxeae]